MRVKWHVLPSALLLLVAGCSTLELGIPIGAYFEQSSPRNFVEVSGRQMRIHIQGVDERDTNGMGLKFNHVLWRDGHLFLVVSRSVELLSGYPSLDYRWDGEKITAKDQKSDRQWEFVK
ncbi:MAG: hypothetical protein H7X97_04745 [Opitutaceae bacterium]|nr:hypothetical protein [Verrucomicrobiales bacterium]